MAVAWRARLVAGITAGAALVAVITLSARDPDFGSPTVVGILVALQVLNWASTYWLQPKGESEVWLLDEAIFIAGVLMLPPAGALLVFAVGTPVGVFLGRVRPVMVVANGGVVTLSAAAGVTVAAVGRGHDDLTFRAAAAAVLGLVVLALVNEVLVAAYLRIIERRPLLPTVVASLRDRASRSAIVASIGLVAGAAGATHSWGALFALPPLVAMQFVLAEHLRARRDRERTAGLFKAAVETHASVQTSDVQDALTRTAARLLRCQAADVLDRPPEAREWGARLEVPGETPLWLVVRDRHGDEALDDEDRQVLSTLAAVGSSALDNARLVEEIQHQALHDALTGLPNQLLFEDRVNQAVTVAHRTREQFAVMVLDIDAFKKVNDTLGHSVGNRLLQVVGDRLVEAVREIDTVARLGSDHYTMLLPGIGSAESACVVAEKILEAIRQPIVLDGHELFMSASLGLALYPEDGSRGEHLLRNADSACRRAKEVGRNSYQIYATGMNELAHLRLTRESELHNAVERGQLRVRYQPQVELRTGRMIGVEALVRWEHPVLGLIGPAEFVPLAEESGLITRVDAWVMREACKQARSWQAEGLPPVRVAVNLSGRHFHNGQLVGLVQGVLAETALDPELLELEVTESMAAGEGEDTALLLQRVREFGVKVAIDDFGTGYSMLSRLQRFPVDRLKIDRSFIAEIASAQGEAPIVAAMIAMARSLHVEVVAEGVETLEQQTFLRNHGCDHAQGYLFSSPLEADDLGRLLATPSVGFNVSVLS